MLRVRPLVALTSATFAVGLGELAVAGILPPIASDVHVTIPAAGQLVGAYALVFAVLTPPLAAAFSNARRKRGLVVGLVTVAIANVLAAVAPAYGLLLGARLLAAAGSALASPLALSLIDDVVPAGSRGRAQGIVFAGFSVAATLGPPFGLIVADHAGWRVVFALIGLACAAAAVLSLGIAVPAVTGPAAVFRWSAARRAITPLVLRVLTISFLTLAAQYVVFTYLRPYLAQTAAYGLDATAFLLFLLGFFGIAGNVGGGMLLDRLGTRTTLLACIGANLALYVVLRFIHAPLWAVALLTAAWGAVSWAMSPAVNNALAENAGDQRDVALALNMTAFNLGIAAGSAIGGAIIATAGIADIMTGGAILLALGLLTTLGLARAQPR